MGDKQPPAAEFEKGANGACVVGLTRHHIVRNSGKLRDLFGDRLTGVGHHIEFFQNLAAAHLYGAYFGYGAVLNGKTCGLNIENYKLVVKIGVGAAENGALRVVNKIRLNAVYDLEILKLFGGKHGGGKALGVSVVGDGNGFLPPCGGTADDILGLRDSVHRRKVCVQVQLHTLYGRVVAADHLLYFLDSFEVYVKFAELVLADAARRGNAHSAFHTFDECL